MDLPRLGTQRSMYRNPYFSVYQLSADFGPFRKKYFVADFGPRAGVLVLRRRSVLLVRQYRLLIHGPSWEIPGGKIDPREKPVDAAIRECREETGVLCRNARPLLMYHPGLDCSYNPTHLFYVTRSVNTKDALRDGREVRQVRWVPFQRCLRMIDEGTFVDALSITALLSYHRRYA